MRDPSRIPLLINELYQIWALAPDLRLGQILGNSGISYYTEDDETLEKLRAQKESLVTRIKSAE